MRLGIIRFWSDTLATLYIKDIYQKVNLPDRPSCRHIDAWKI